ncbi:glycosyltransferase [candidate division KSB1 bacterium]|nr:glycosyltransferase family 4 protein [candidate division KSB1 bacterium]RQW07178.1 MAG: glycosyltransferase [candidate division KSB1 bacterium]
MVDDRTNILHVINLSEIGGAEKLLLSLAEHVNKKQFNVVIASLAGDGPLAQKVESLGLPFYNLNLKRLCTFPWRVRKIISQHDIGIVQTHGARAELAATLLAKVLHVRCVISTIHDIYSFDNKFKLFFSKLLRPLIAHWITVSEMGKMLAIERLGIKPQHISVIYTGVKATKAGNTSAPQALNKSNKSKQTFTILTVANLRPVKGHSTILQAIDLMPDSTKERIKFCFVGADQSNGRVQKQAEELGVAKYVNFAGFQDNIDPYLNSADIFLLASKSEGIPISLLEAMSAGLPVIATRVGGMPEIVQHRVNGLLIKANAPSAIAESIQELMTNTELRTQLSDLAFESCLEKFSLNRMIEKYERLYQEVCA